MLELCIYLLAGLLIAEALIIAAKAQGNTFRVTAGHYILCLLLWPIIVLCATLKAIRS